MAKAAPPPMTRGVPKTMVGMQLQTPGAPLRRSELAVPEPGPGQLLLRVAACGVCRTDLHILDGELPPRKLPLIPGHEIVGRVISCGKDCSRFQPGARVGVPWLAWTDNSCRYCRSGRENLCTDAEFTGYSVDGGYAAYTVADERYCLSIPADYGDVEAAPLLCAGLIGYRAYRMAGEHAERLGLYGFGAAAHLLAQLAVAEGRQVYAFTRPGDTAGQRFALELGAVWAGASTGRPPEPLDAAILFAPVGALVPEALRSVARGGSVICAGIHMSDIPAFPYKLLWNERTVRSVANLTRDDGESFMKVAARHPIRSSVTGFRLQEANEALAALRGGRIHGAAVLDLDDS